MGSARNVSNGTAAFHESIGINLGMVCSSPVPNLGWPRQLVK
jgi:hypothetical protein